MLSLRKEFFLALTVAALASGAVYLFFYKPGKVENVEIKRTEPLGIRALASQAIDLRKLSPAAAASENEIIPSIAESGSELPKVCRESKVMDSILGQEFERLYAQLPELPKEAKECLAELRAPATCFAVERRMESRECLDAVLIARARLLDAMSPLASNETAILANKIIARLFHKERLMSDLLPEIEQLSGQLSSMQSEDEKLRNFHSRIVEARSGVTSDAGATTDLSPERLLD